MVYVTRNTRDVSLSLLNHWEVMYGYSGSFDLLLNEFLNNKGGTGLYMPFFHHILGYWEKRDLPHILPISYEDMKRDLGSIIRKHDYWLGISFYKLLLRFLFSELQASWTKTSLRQIYPHLWSTSLLTT